MIRLMMEVDNHLFCQFFGCLFVKKGHIQFLNAYMPLSTAGTLEEAKLKIVFFSFWTVQVQVLFHVFLILNVVRAYLLLCLIVLIHSDTFDTFDIFDTFDTFDTFDIFYIFYTFDILYTFYTFYTLSLLIHFGHLLLLPIIQLVHIFSYAHQHSITVLELSF